MTLEKSHYLYNFSSQPVTAMPLPVPVPEPRHPASVPINWPSLPTSGPPPPAHVAAMAPGPGRGRSSYAAVARRPPATASTLASRTAPQLPPPRPPSVRVRPSSNGSQVTIFSCSIDVLDARNFTLGLPVRALMEQTISRISDNDRTVIF